MDDLLIKSHWELPIIEPKSLTREARIDELTRDAMYRDWDWVHRLDMDDLREIVVTVVEASWRGKYRDDTERLYAIKDVLDSYVETYAENEANNED